MFKDGLVWLGLVRDGPKPTIANYIFLLTDYKAQSTV